MINWFKKKVISWVREDWDSASNKRSNRGQRGLEENTIGTVVPSSRLQQHGMNFTLYSASGGYIMEYNTYNHNTDTRYNALHIIPSDQELGQGIAHIITLEMLKK
jgi:hypothetical protein